MTGKPNGQVELFQDKNLEWRWRRRVLNGNVVADSGEGYVRAVDARAMVDKMFPGVPVVTVTDDDAD